MRRIIFICLAVGLSAGVPPPATAQDAYDARRLEASKKQYPANEDNVAAGREVYAKRCSFCHGDEGQGDGGAAPYLDPRPRDFTMGLFKFRSTLSGELPTDEDLFRIISRGVTGTAMPAWGEPPFALSERERWQVVHFLKQLATEDFADPDFDPYEQRVEIPPPPASTPERVLAGKDLFSNEKKGGCVKCHGNAGRGDGKEAGTQQDDWGDPILPADLTKSWNYKNGASLLEIFRTLSTGMTGTPMPGYAETLSEDERWDLAYYVQSLLEQGSGDGQIVLVAKRHDGALPLDPTDPFWEEQASLDVPMAGQAVVTPRHANSTINLVSIRAAYNGEELAFHFSWNDRFEDVGGVGDPEGGGGADTTDNSGEDGWIPELDENDGFVRAAEMWERRKMGFKDRLQIQFPIRLQDGPEKPFFFMGDPRHKVNLWTWQADWNANPETHGGTAVEERNAAGYKKAPTTQDQEGRVLEGRAVFEDGEWRLVLRRRLATADKESDTQFEPGAFVPFAIQAWDGGNGEEGLLCAMSSWYYVVLEGQTDRAGYVWALMGVLLVLGGETIAVRRARKSTRIR